MNGRSAVGMTTLPKRPAPGISLESSSELYIASRFSDEMIEAIVDTGELSDPEAARYLTDVIIKRRDKVVAYWIGQTNPLDRFAVSRTSTGAELTFDNAAIRLSVASPGASYKVGWLSFDNTAIMQRAIGEESDLRHPRAHVPDAAWGPRDNANYRYAIASIKTVDAE